MLNPRQSALINTLKKKGYTITNPEGYENINSIISIECSNGHRQTKSIGDFEKANWECIDCIKLHEQNIKDKKPFLLAFDISTNTCGWAVFNKENQLLNSGIIEVNKNFPLLRRTSSLLKKISTLLKKMPVKHIVITKPELDNKIAEISIMKTIGVIQYWLYKEYKIQTVEYSKSGVIKKENASLDSETLIMRYKYIYNKTYPLQQCTAIACGKYFFQDDETQYTEEAVEQLLEVIQTDK